MLIEKLRLKNLLSFRDATIELGPLNVLIGPNGVGKSNRHAPRLLELINPALVCAAARNCDRFFKAIQKHLA